VITFTSQDVPSVFVSDSLAESVPDIPQFLSVSYKSFSFVDTVELPVGITADDDNDN